MTSSYCVAGSAAPIVPRNRVPLPSIKELSECGYLPPLISPSSPLSSYYTSVHSSICSPATHGLLCTPPASPTSPTTPMGTSSPSTASVGWPYHVPLTLPAYPANPNSRTVLRPVATHYWRRRGPNGRNSTGIRKCTQCQTTSTRAWRPGPQGSATLCDRCGKKYKRKIAHHARSASPTQSPRSSGSSSYCITPPPLDLASNPIMESGHTPTSHHHELFLKLLN